MSANAPQQVAPPPPKKGTSPILWIGLGCGGILILTILIVVLGGMYVWGRANSALEDTGQVIVVGEEGTTALRHEGQDMVMTAPDGSESITGPGAEQRIPQWAVRYPGATYSFGSVTMSGTTIAGNTTFTSADQPDTVRNFYRERLEGQGYEVVAPPSSQISTINASITGPDRRITLIITPTEQGSQITMAFNGER